ncbi:DUF4113 domain-containing protein [Salmonella enterica subsp. diarizonae]|nr:DUF4113 domain-containing protein [Salmonella enterica subsp. diarizonae]
MEVLDHLNAKVGRGTLYFAGERLNAILWGEQVGRIRDSHPFLTIGMDCCLFASWDM